MTRSPYTYRYKVAEVKVKTLADLEDRVITLEISFPWKGHCRLSGRVRVINDVAWVGDFCIDKDVKVERDRSEGLGAWTIWSRSLEDLGARR